MKLFIITLMLMTTTFVNASNKETIIPESAKQEIISTIEMENLMGARQLMDLKQKFKQQRYQQNTVTLKSSDGTASISGNVVDGLGTPILAHQVSLGYWDSVSELWTFEANIATDVAGNYTFTLLAANTYIVQIGNGTDDYLDYIWNVTTAGQELCSGCAIDLTDNGIILVDAAVIANIDFQAPLGGVIEGSITDSVSAAGIDTFALGFIEINDDTFGYQLETTVDPITGVYSVRGIPDGQFRTFLSPNQGNQHIPEIYGGSQCNDCWSLLQGGSGSVLTITGANTLSNIDFTPELGASISGFLFDVLDIQPNYDYGLIMIFNELNQNLAFIIVEGNMLDPLNNGAYTVGGLLAGSYYIQGGDLGRQYFQRELFENIPCPWSGCDRGDGDPITLAHQENRLGINIPLDLGGKIEGFITDALTFNGLDAIDQNQQYFQVFDAAGEVAGGGTVSSPGPNGTGAYILSRSIAPGDYTLRTGSMFLGYFNEPYIEELYPNIACPGETCDFSSAGPGTPITVTLSTTTAPIDLALSIGNSISGTITELGGGAVIADVHVLIYDDSVPPRFAAWDTTDAAGNFTVSGLPNGNYYALTNNGSNLPFMGLSPTDPAGWIDILHNGIACPGGSCDFTTGDIIVVPTPRNAAISINLSQGATIAGKITDFNLQSGIADIVVNVFDDLGGLIASYQTNTLGDYITSGLPAGTYYLTTSSDEVLADTTYGGGNCFIDNCDPLTGTPVIIVDQQVASGFDMVLRSNLLFKGTFE